MKNVIGPDGVRYPVTPDVERFLRSMDRGALRSLVLDMAAHSPEAMRSLQLRATPAGLWELAPAATPDLLLTVTDTSPLDLARSAMQGERPGVRIEGDVQFAAEVNWLVDHVRWDAEEDLSRVIGDAPAHTLGNIGRSMAQALRTFVSKLPGQGKADA